MDAPTTPSTHPRAAYRLARRQAAPWVDLLRFAKMRAGRRALPFALDAAWARSQWTGFCSLSGVAFQIGGAPGLSPSLDRIDKARGWTPDNCRFILAALGAARCSGLSDAGLVKVAAQLAATAGSTADDDAPKSDTSPARSTIPVTAAKD